MSRNENDFNGNRNCKFPAKMVEPTEDDHLAPGQPSRLGALAGRAIVFSVLVSIIFVGLLVNLAQLIVLVSLNLNKQNTRWRRLHKRLNSYLVYTLLAPGCALFYYWSRIKVNIHLADKGLLETPKQPLLGIVLPNHSYEMDYIPSFVLADQMGNLGAYRSMSKDEIKYLPIIGWCLWMSDFVFVKRDGRLNRDGMGRMLDELFDYDQTLLGLFSEGTRWTEEKYLASVEFAKSRGIKPYKYHLVPKTRGFAYTIRHYIRQIELEKKLDRSLFRVFNVEIIMPDKPTFKDFLDGKQLRADVHCEEILLSHEIREEILKSAHEDECPKLAELLYEIFRRKDQLIDEYKLNGNTFSKDEPSGAEFPYKRRLLPLVITLIGFCFTYTTLIYLAIGIFAQSTIFWSLLIGYLTACAWMLRRIMWESQAQTSGGDLKCQLGDHRLKLDQGQQDKRQPLEVAGAKSQDCLCANVGEQSHCDKMVSDEEQMGGIRMREGAPEAS